MSRTIEVLVEERSAEEALNSILPRICPGAAFSIHAYRGKPDLLKKLPARLAGYERWAPSQRRLVVILVDRDADDCFVLKAKLEGFAREARLATPRTASAGQQPTLLTRIAVEELEAWFFGDVAALRAAYPRIPASLAAKAAFRYPDEISGGTAEALERILKRHGYCQAGLSKIANAAKVAASMDVERNSSPSFLAFRDGLRRLVSEESCA